MLCKICGYESKEVFRAKILQRYKVAYYHCPYCGFLQTSEPFWLDESYENPINLSDTGYLFRNLILAKKTFFLFLCLFGKKKKFLDYAGGYGVLTRLLRDWGLDFYWSDKYTKNIFSNGFSYDKQDIVACTCFECFEHLVNPLSELEKMLAISRNIFFSTSLIPEKFLPKQDWKYYGFNHGQHVSFYSLKTLHFLADKYKLNLYSNGDNLHLLSDQKISSWRFYLILKLGLLPWDLLSRLILRSRMVSDNDYIINLEKKY